LNTKNDNDISNLSSKSTKFLNLLKEYKGFNMNRVGEYFIYKNYNINVCLYIKDSNSGGHYSHEERYQHPNPNNNAMDVNITMVNIKDQNCIFHIKDVGKATGLIVYPKFHYVVFHNERYNHNKFKKSRLQSLVNRTH
jgi:hypothetical protein